MNMRKIFSLVLVLLLVFSLAACGSKEEKRMKFYNRGVELFEKGDYVKARLEFQNAIQIDKDFAGAYLMLGKTALKDGNFQGAFGSYAKAVALDPELLDAQLELGKLFLLGKALDKATEKADLVLGKAPTNEEAVLLKASILLAAKDYGNAKGLLAGLLERGVKKPEVYILLAQARPFSQNDNDPELAAAEKILQDGIQVNQGKCRAPFHPGQIVRHHQAGRRGRRYAAQGYRLGAGQGGVQAGPGGFILGEREGKRGQRNPESRDSGGSSQ